MIELRRDLLIQVFSSCLARGAVAIGGLALAVILARIYGPSGVGLYALAHSIYLGCVTFSRFGMDNAIMQRVGRNCKTEAVKIYLAWGCGRAFLYSMVCALIVIYARGAIEDLLRAEGLSSVLLGVSFAIPAFSLSFMLAGFLKGVRKPASACLLENGSVALVAGFFVMIFNHYIPHLGVATIGWSYAVSAWLVFLLGLLRVVTYFERQSVPLKDEGFNRGNELKSFKSSSVSFFVMSLSSFMQAVLSVIIAGWMLSSDDLGLFKSSQQMAGVIGFVLVVINAVFPPRFSSLYHERKYEELASLAKLSAGIGFSLSLPLLILCLLFPHWVLGLLGDDFVQASSLLKIIAFAQLLNVVAGPSVYLLYMGGQEVLMRNVSLISGILGLVPLFLLIPVFGVLGAAISLAIILVMQSIVALFLVWKRMGIWPLPAPNFLKACGVNPKLG